MKAPAQRQPAARRYRASETTRHVIAAVALLATLTILGWYLLGHRWHWAQWIAAWFIAANLMSFAYYGIDKARARGGVRRIPERILHGLAAAGGSLGAYAAMRVFRHKTIKGSFQIVFWGIAAVQIALLAVVLRELWLG